MLSFISSYLGSHRPPAGQLASATPSGGMDASPSGGSGAIELHSENRMWEVQWEELTILRMIGHGSYGSVYLAEWKQTPVAVKVLVGKGEQDGEARRERQLQACQRQAVVSCAAGNSSCRRLAGHILPASCHVPCDPAAVLQKASSVGSWSCRIRWCATCRLRPQ